jgi:hypothetical protein
MSSLKKVVDPASGELSMKSVLDHRGIIRHKYVGFPGEETFDKAIDFPVEMALKEAPSSKPSP